MPSFHHVGPDVINVGISVNVYDNGGEAAEPFVYIQCRFIRGYGKAENKMLSSIAEDTAVCSRSAACCRIVVS